MNSLILNLDTFYIIPKQTLPIFNDETAACKEVMILYTSCHINVLLSDMKLRYLMSPLSDAFFPSSQKIPEEDDQCLFLIKLNAL